MAKLHEIIAVAKGQKGKMDTLMADLVNSFIKKRHNFSEKVKTTVYFDEDTEQEQEFESSITTTVSEELNWLGEHFVETVKVINQMALGNQLASADLKFGGTTIAYGVPATTLVELESWLGKLKQVLSAIPTLDPSKGFETDYERGEEIFKARPVRKNKTKKVPKSLKLEEASGNRQGQFHVYNEDVTIGKITEQEWSSLITPARKSRLLDNVEQMIQEVQQARSRANETEINEGGDNLGAALIGLLLS